MVLSKANCREGPGQEYRVITVFETGQELLLVGLNPDMSWGKFEGSIGAKNIQCWIGLSMVDTKGYMDVPILEVPAVPVTSTCSQYTIQKTCAQRSECSWSNLTAGPAVCRAK